jgi:valyl-tRNA synthetase
VPHDEKTKTVVLEPMMTEQWYLNVQPLADKAIKAVEDGRTKFVPDNWTGVYFNWMRNIHPWCISRQLWWGHQIPAWYLPVWNINLPLPSWVGNEHVAAESEAEAIEQALQYYKANADDLGLPKDNLKIEVLAEEPKESWISIISDVREKGRPIPIWRDPDVLDTWFSSALWAFSTLGWPDRTPELKRFYPTSVLVTGFDIIFFWVARMMMMSLWFMEDVPFHTVFIHTRVLDEKGVKMSKTKGNVVDPLDLIDEYGADALRFTLALAAGQGRDMRIGPSRVEVNRNFVTKLWNATRFCEMNGCETVAGFDPAKVTLTPNQWIVAETAATAQELTTKLEALRFNEAAGSAYHFIYDVFCDWYLEIAKPIFNGSDEKAKAETRATAAWVRDTIFQLLHPFMPFVTEELWARTAVAPRTSMLIEGPWPGLSALPKFEDASRAMNWVIDLVKGVRSVRSEMNVPPAAKVALVLKDADAKSKAALVANHDVILTLARLSSADVADALPKGSAQFVLGEATVGLPLGDVIDFAKERARLEKELKKAQEEIGRIDAKLSNEQFVSRAPEDVLAEQREKRAEYAATAARLKEAVARLA